MSLRMRVSDVPYWQRWHNSVVTPQHSRIEALLASPTLMPGSFPTGAGARPVVQVAWKLPSRNSVCLGGTGTRLVAYRDSNRSVLMLDGKRRNTMSGKFSQSVVFALVGLFVAVSLVFAQAQPSPKNGIPGTQPGAGVADPRQPRSMSTPGMESQIGTMGTQEIFAAIVTTVNPQQRTVTLRMQGGETVELKVSEPLLTELQTGDSVQVSISKSE